MTSNTTRSFEPDGDSVAGTAVQDSGSPVAAVKALARFEFESGRGNEGTKILMVEWEDNIDAEDSGSGDWQVSWPGKRTVLSANDRTSDQTRRLYFLLPPSTTVPPVVTLRRTSQKPDTSPVFEIKSLPAIFPPELGASARASGKKGVLHTIWAKKRVSVLQSEIEEETKNNFEGIGLEMALQEKDWIEQNFGISSRPAAGSISSVTSSDAPTSPLSPTSPRTPGGGRLAEKMKGLRLGTTPQDLKSGQNGSQHDGNAQESTSAAGNRHPLSPETSDVAISSFAAFHHSASQDPQQVAGVQPSGVTHSRVYAAQGPPSSIRSQQHRQPQTGFGSLASAFDGTATQPRPPPSQTAPSQSSNDGQEEGLFAVAMSPRSPDMAKSPFSFSSHDTMASISGR